MSEIAGWKKKAFWIRLFHWEYWSFQTVYTPIYPVFIFLCLRARSFFFFAASNPTMENGGFLGESKKDLYALIPSSFQPKTIFFTCDIPAAEVLKRLNENGFAFPLIGKPDIGGRGRGIKKLDNESSVLEYASNAKISFHIQEFIPYEYESGIFYYRFPNQKKGNISGIVDKEFLKVTGDGRQSVRGLLKTNSRAILQLPQLELNEPEKLNFIVPAGESYTVVPYGNHARGALFLDGTSSVNENLIAVLDDICVRISGFYFGRLDIKYESRELLEQGQAFSIIEVNGAGSEPTHIYDPRHSIFFAWKEIIRHWIILYQISRANHRLGHPYLSLQEGVRMFRKNKSDARILQTMKS